MNTSTQFDFDGFRDLVAHAHDCRLCPEMSECNRVLTDANGPPNARIMFIGEAPGRLGAERTAVPFHGDVAGDNFERLLALAGLNRGEVFVTNAILCNPTDASGNNAPPSKQALRNCSSLLAEQLSVIDPILVVTLGAAALNALSLVYGHELRMAKHVRTIQNWNGRKVIPLYHPGARAMIHRNFVAQTADYYFVGETYRRIITKRRRTVLTPPERQGWEIVRYVLSCTQKLSLFQLHKIMYLIDYHHHKQKGDRLTDFFYVRQKDGPYCVELGSRWYKKFDGLQVTFTGGAPILHWHDEGLFADKASLSPDTQQTLDVLLQPLCQLTDSQLKTQAYLTAPMKRALRAERSGLIGLNRTLL